LKLRQVTLGSWLRCAPSSARQFPSGENWSRRGQNTWREPCGLRHPHQRVSVNSQLLLRSSIAASQRGVRHLRKSKPRNQNTSAADVAKRFKANSVHCKKCDLQIATRRLVEVARVGRIAGHTPAAIAKEAETQRHHAQARSAWRSTSLPAWLTEQAYGENIQPLLTRTSSSAIAKHIGVSRWYAGRIREGHRPHPRHWQALAQLVSSPCQDNPTDQDKDCSESRNGFVIYTPSRHKASPTDC
jgi:hypothetical protein